MTGLTAFRAPRTAGGEANRLVLMFPERLILFGVASVMVVELKETLREQEVHGCECRDHTQVEMSDAGLTV